MDVILAVSSSLYTGIRIQPHLLLTNFQPREISTGTAGIALIGEAGGFISPSSAEGLSYAFKSALALADVLHERPDDFEIRFKQRTVRIRANLLVKNLKSQFIYQSRLRNIIMKTGLKSMKIHHG